MTGRRATVPQCVVLLHDLSTMLPAGGEMSLLEWQMREFSRFGVTEFLLCGPGAATAAARALRLPRPARVVPIETADVDPGTWQAACADRLQDRFLLWNGHVGCDANLAPLLRAAQGGDGALRALLRADGPAPVDSGIRLLHRGASLDANTGTQPVVVSGRPVAPAFLTASPARKALFLDRDGVLNVDHGYVGTQERFEWIDGALDAVRLATESGCHVFIVTNQSGVARGLYDEDAVRTLLDWIADSARQAGGTIDDARYCPYHPEAVLPAYRQVHPWRKPQPGMLLDLIARWALDPQRAVMIGDQASDLQAAAAAGVSGHLFPGGNLLAFLRPILLAMP